MNAMAQAAAQNAAFERDDWWQRDGAFRLLHDINPLRLKWLLAQCARGSPGGGLRDKRLLDIGCGGGIFAEAAAKAGAKVTGLDAAAAAIAAATAHAAQGGLDIAYHQGDDINALPPGAPLQYEVITCFEVLEHTAQPAARVADIATRLAPGGIAVFSTINRTARAWALMVLALEHVLRVIPPSTHDYRQFVTPAELARACRHSGLSVTDICGMRYSFFGHFYRLTADTGVNYFLAAKREAD